MELVTLELITYELVALKLYCGYFLWISMKIKQKSVDGINDTNYYKCQDSQPFIIFYFIGAFYALCYECKIIKQTNNAAKKHSLNQRSQLSCQHQVKSIKLTNKQHGVVGNPSEWAFNFLNK